MVQHAYAYLLCFDISGMTDSGSWLHSCKQYVSLEYVYRTHSLCMSTDLEGAFYHLPCFCNLQACIKLSKFP